jgi:GNAT superfamily N-acetyltransferase
VVIIHTSEGIVGWAAAFKEWFGLADTYYTLGAFVDEQHRHKGLATAALDKLLANLPDVDCVDFMYRAKALYVPIAEKHGKQWATVDSDCISYLECSEERLAQSA